jgi:hypothetical protein
MCKFLAIVQVFAAVFWHSPNAFGTLENVDRFPRSLFIVFLFQLLRVRNSSTLHASILELKTSYV